MVPIVYSHGSSSNRTMHSGTCKDFASHGYIVFAIDHHDGTCSYYQKQDGTKVHYINSKLDDIALRKAQTQIRTTEVMQLIDELYSGSISSKLNLPVQFDLTKLTVAGHSFGGTTAVHAAMLDHRIKACLPLDPWLYLWHKEINDGS